MTITSIQQAKKNENRVNLFLDEEFWVGIDKNDLITFGLHKGLEIDEETKKQIEKASKQGKLINRIMKYVAIRPRSIKEVKDYLKRKAELDEDELKATLASVASLLNDQEFATWYTENRKNFGFHGDNKIRAELIKKGVDRKIIDNVLAESKNEVEEIEKIKKLIEKVEPKIKAKDEFEKKRKLIQRLIARGFSYDLVKKAMS